MTEEQRKHLERRLLEERSRVIGALDQYRARNSDTPADRSGDLSHYPIHLADEGTDTIEDEIDAVDASRVTGELQQIDDALERLYQHPDRFGRDEKTGHEIPFERLDLVPWARTDADHHHR
jgi:DnaK suppressor protein